MSCRRVLTTSSSFVTIGSRLPPTPRSFGISGVTLPSNGRNAINVPGPFPSTLRSTRLIIPVMAARTSFLSMDPYETRSGVAPRAIPYDLSTSGAAWIFYKNIFLIDPRR